MENDIIEIAPLAYMRGRTLNDAFIILDEGQNTTVRADEDVPDAHGPRLEDRRDRRRHAGGLPPGRVSGLAEAARILAHVDGISVVRFSNRDVVRHRLVRDIVVAYERHAREEGALQPEEEAFLGEKQVRPARDEGRPRRRTPRSARGGGRRCWRRHRGRAQARRDAMKAEFCGKPSGSTGLRARLPSVPACVASGRSSACRTAGSPSSSRTRRGSGC